MVIFKTSPTAYRLPLLQSNRPYPIIRTYFCTVKLCGARAKSVMHAAGLTADCVRGSRPLEPLLCGKGREGGREGDSLHLIMPTPPLSRRLFLLVKRIFWLVQGSMTTAPGSWAMMHLPLLRLLPWSGPSKTALSSTGMHLLKSCK